MIRDQILDRFVPTQSIHNFRDYGGYSARDGARVRSGVLFRSGHHADAGEGDLEQVAEIDLAHVIDLRGNSERAKHACRRPDGFAAQVLFFDGETAGLSLAPHEEAASGGVDAEGARQAMVELYGRLPDRKGLNWVLQRFFAALADGKGASLVHCAAGKDRTGIAVDLLHHVLGVHPDDAMHDYLLTNEAPNNEERIAHGLALIGDKYGAKDEAAVRVLMGVEAEYLEAARRSVREHFGSTDTYLEEGLGVDDAIRERLRETLLA